MTIINKDCLDAMREMESNSISAIVTDPPYGLSFMGKDWDHGIPGIPFWEEALRISKPGSHLLAFGGTRTFHRLACAIEDAGWEIRDCISWLYGSGFPKSHNHFGIEGYGTALKPAWEPIIMAMKPCDGTFKQNAEKWGQAGMNIDGCRIEGNWERSTLSRADIKGGNYGTRTNKRINCLPQASHPQGRWPSNLILDGEAGKMLDEQTGKLKNNCGIHGTFKGGRTSNQIGGGGKTHDRDYDFKGYHDSGGASRFFYCAKASSSERNDGLEEMPLKECGIKNDSGRGFSENDPYKIVKYKNNHPTVKPLKLMEYLIKLVMPPLGGILLDPFAGSGTTILAAKRLGFQAVGIEKDPGYCEIAKARIDNYSKNVNIEKKEQLELFAQAG